MNCIIPFTKDIKFKTNIGEILSVSLEHEYTANNSEVLGNFIISGEYKAHEVSINKEKFEYTLPFSLELTERIDSDSVDFAVEDFTYEIIDNDTLRVNIEYSINALEEKEEEVPEKEEISEVTLEEMLDEIDREEKQKEEEAIKQENEILEAKEESKEDLKEEVKEELKEEPTNNIEERDNEEMIKEREEVSVNEEAKSTILNSISESEEEYVTYHVCMYQENDTIETICTKYNTSKNILEEYNDLSNLVVGDKIIIPEINE